MKKEKKLKKSTSPLSFVSQKKMREMKCHFFNICLKKNKEKKKKKSFNFFSCEKL